MPKNIPLLYPVPRIPPPTFPPGYLDGLRNAVSLRTWKARVSDAMFVDDSRAAADAKRRKLTELFAARNRICGLGQSVDVRRKRLFQRPYIVSTPAARKELGCSRVSLLSALAYMERSDASPDFLRWALEEAADDTAAWNRGYFKNALHISVYFRNPAAVGMLLEAATKNGARNAKGVVEYVAQKVHEGERTVLDLVCEQQSGGEEYHAVAAVFRAFEIEPTCRLPLLPSMNEFRTNTKLNKYLRNKYRLRHDPGGPEMHIRRQMNIADAASRNVDLRDEHWSVVSDAAAAMPVRIKGEMHYVIVAPSVHAVLDKVGGSLSPFLPILQRIVVRVYSQGKLETSPRWRLCTYGGVGAPTVSIWLQKTNHLTSKAFRQVLATYRETEKKGAQNTSGALFLGKSLHRGVRDLREEEGENRPLDDSAGAPPPAAEAAAAEAEAAAVRRTQSMDNSRAIQREYRTRRRRRNRTTTTHRKSR